MKVLEEVDAKKDVVTGDGVWKILAGTDRVYVASGQKTLIFTPDDSNRDELLKKASGRTGNLRAPTVRLGTSLYVGFNQEMYKNLFDS